MHPSRKTESSRLLTGVMVSVNRIQLAEPANDRTCRNPAEERVMRLPQPADPATGRKAQSRKLAALHTTAGCQTVRLREVQVDTAVRVGHGHQTVCPSLTAQSRLAGGIARLRRQRLFRTG